MANRDTTPAPPSTPFTGGCLCGAVRYRAAGHLGKVSACHCRHCQAVSGAPLVVWAAVGRAQFAWTAAPPCSYRHRSDWPTLVTRSFCGICGSTLTYEREGEDEIDVATASMDDPDLVVPDRHVYASRMHAWLRLADSLPRHDTVTPRSTDS